MSLLVQKFGGTSVATRQSREAVAAKVREAREHGFDVVVVTSAMGRSGDPYATDTLTNIVSDPESLSPRDLDLILMCGEIIAAGVLTTLLRQQIDKVAMLTGWQAGIITDEQHGDAHVIEIRPSRLQQLLNSGHVVVVTGFQGISEHEEITTLGRGGSDTTAAALGAALGACLVEIYTDVDGIMTADPRLVPEAEVLPLLDYAAALKIARGGAQVLHPRAVEMAMQGNIPLVVKNLAGNHPGTRINSCGDRS